jgi:hypothetical protein
MIEPSGVIEDIHASHFLYVLDFKNDKDKFLYNLRYCEDNIDLYYKYDEWNTKHMNKLWGDSVQQLLDDGYLGGNKE